MRPSEIFVSHQPQYFNLITTFQVQNKLINLSSFNDFESVMNKHVLDSLEIFSMPSFIKVLTSGLKYDIADIGSGGGFPGLVLAVALPQCNFYLIESITKKCSAMNEILKTLNITNVKIINDRAENITQKFDIVVSRAVAEFKVIHKLSQNICKPNGKLYLYKSKKEEITDFNDKIDYKIGDDLRAIYEFNSAK